MTWIISIAIASIMSTFGIISLKLSNTSIDIMNAIPVYFGACFLASVLLSFSVAGFVGGSAFNLDIRSIVWLCVAGVFLVFNEFFFLSAIHLNMPLGSGKLLYSVLSIVALLVVGILFFKEAITIQKAVGVILSLTGVALILR